MRALKSWLKAGRTPLARQAFELATSLRDAALPAIPGLHSALYHLHGGLRGLYADLVRRLWTTPLLKSRIAGPAPGLYLYGGLPLLTGPLEIRAGRNVRWSGASTVSGRTCAARTPRLEIGDNAGIGWQTTIAVGTRVVIGDNVRMAGRTILAGYPGHPFDAADRAAGKPETDDQVGDIILERDVWLATGVMVMAGVTIGQGTIVAAGSVVTKSLPARVLAGGVPARVIRQLVPAKA